MMPPTVIRGLSDAYGSWKIICMSRRCRRMFSLLNSNRSAPAKRTCPAVASISRSMSLPSVVLPQPLSPTTPKVSPRPIVRSTPSTALTWACTRPQNPSRTGKYFLRPLTSTKGAAWLIRPLPSNSPPSARPQPLLAAEPQPDSEHRPAGSAGQSDTPVGRRERRAPRLG